MRTAIRTIPETRGPIVEVGNAGVAEEAVDLTADLADRAGTPVDRVQRVVGPVVRARTEGQADRVPTAGPVVRARISGARAAQVVPADRVRKVVGQVGRGRKAGDLADRVRRGVARGRRVVDPVDRVRRDGGRAGRIVVTGEIVGRGIIGIAGPGRNPVLPC